MTPEELAQLHSPKNWFPLETTLEAHDAAPPRPLRVPLTEDGHGFRLVPLTLQHFRVGPFVLSLLSSGHVHDDEVEYDEAACKDATGSILWPASTLVVGLLLATYGSGTSRSVLELGCGTGFCGLVARRLCERVVLSDRSAVMRALAARNSAMQSLPVDAVEGYGWALGDPWPAKCGDFDLVLASDVLYTQHERYEPDMLRRFAELVDWSLGSDGVAIIGHVERTHHGTSDLCAALSEREFVVTVLDAAECVPPEIYGREGNFGLTRAVCLWCTRRRRGRTPKFTDFAERASSSQ